MSLLGRVANWVRRKFGRSPVSAPLEPDPYEVMAAEFEREVGALVQTAVTQSRDRYRLDAQR